MEKNEIRKIARLARIEIEDEKLEKFTEEFNKILKYFEKLKEADTEKVEPFTFLKKNSFREDVAKKFEDPDKILEIAPCRSDRFFKVKKVIE